MRQCLWLIKNGIPFDVAFALDDTKRTAWCLIFSEMERGKRYNFDSRTFEDIK
jgi:hypothetical protein